MSGYISPIGGSAKKRILAAGRAYNDRIKAAARAVKAAADAERKRIEAEAREVREADMAEQAAQAEARFRATKRAPSMEEILADVCARHELNPIAVRGERRATDLCRARHEAMWLIREQTGFSFPMIGRFFHRDHSTVQAACWRHQQRLYDQPVGIGESAVLGLFRNSHKATVAP